MITFPEGVYRKNDKIITRKIAGETLLVPISGNLADMQKIFALDDVAAFIWERLDGSLNLGGIHTQILEVFSAPPKTAKIDMLDFLEELYQAGLLDNLDPKVTQT